MRTDEMLTVMEAHDLQQNRIDSLCAILRVQRCHTRPISIGECVDQELCRCTCGLLLTKEPS